MSKTLFEKVWDAHIVSQDEGAPAVLYIDAHLIHEVTSPQAFATLRAACLCAARTHLCHHQRRRIPRAMWTLRSGPPTLLHRCAHCVKTAPHFGVLLWDIKGDVQGIVDVVGPEMGVTQPGMTIVCGDSHTSTHGAFGALAFGIGTSEVGHVLATQCLLQKKPVTLRHQR